MSVLHKLFSILTTVAPSMDVMMSKTDTLHKNRCDLCDHKPNADGGHCYMFKQEPDVCHALKQDKRLNQNQ